MGVPWQVMQSPRDLASLRFSWAMRLCSALRSGVCALFRSYARRTSFLASTCSGVGSTRAFGFLAFGVAFRDVFTVGLFQLWGRPPLLAGFGREKVNLKVWPIAHSCGAKATGSKTSGRPVYSHPSSIFPRGRKQRPQSRPVTESLNNELEVCQFYFGGITVNGGCVNFKLAKMLRIKLALTLSHLSSFPGPPQFTY